MLVDIFMNSYNVQGLCGSTTSRSGLRGRSKLGARCNSLQSILASITQSNANHTVLSGLLEWYTKLQH